MIQSSQESYGFATDSYGGHRCCRQVFIVIEAFLAVAVRVEIFQQTSGEENQRNDCRTKTAIVYPEIECTSEKASEQMNFEVTQLKFIRCNSTFFVHRMYPSHYVPMYYDSCLRSKISI